MNKPKWYAQVAVAFVILVLLPILIPLIIIGQLLEIMRELSGWNEERRQFIIKVLEALGELDRIILRSIYEDRFGNALAGRGLYMLAVDLERDGWITIEIRHEEKYSTAYNPEGTMHFYRLSKRGYVSKKVIRRLLLQFGVVDHGT